MKLYIIGNGFDIAHKLPTSYQDFHLYLKYQNPDLAHTLTKYFNFEYGSDYLWREFERDLDTFDYRSFFHDHNNLEVFSEGFKPSEGYGLQDAIIQETEELVNQIRSEFYNWVSSIDYAKRNFEIFPEIVDSADHAKFLCFNYTSTLEEVYRTQNVTYIHNNAADNFDDLILGHGESRLRQPLVDELDENGNSNRTLFTDAIHSSALPFFALKKDTDTIIEGNQDFFKNLYDVREIVVIGHSLGEVDLPYFKEIAQKCKIANWRINCHEAKDKLRAIEVVDKLSLDFKKVKYEGQAKDFTSPTI